MKPRLRHEQPGAIYHVIARGVDRRRIFVDSEDYERYTGLLAAVTKRQRWHLLAYCLMPNHVHLLIEIVDANLANGMQLLHGRYARMFNQRHGRSGHLFEARYLSPLARDPLSRTAGYVVVNPVAAALCEKARDWPWGSHAQICGDGSLPDWLAHDRLCAHLAEDTGSARYHELVAARERLWSAQLSGSR